MAINNDPTLSKMFTDLSSLQRLKVEAGEDQAGALRKAAGEFEQLFLNMLLKSMRDANETIAKDSFLYSNNVRFYQDMYDQQLSLEMAQNQGIGLADILVQQLDKKLERQSVSAEVGELSDVEMMLRRAYYNSGQQATEGMVEALAAKPAGTLPEAQAPDASLAHSMLNNSSERGAASAVSIVDDAVPFTGPEDFVRRLMPLAQAAAQQLGVEPKVLVAQAALETGWGAHVLADKSGGGSSYNLFNIKADSRWLGSATSANTLEYRDGVGVKENASFRVYGSYEESFNDYVSFLQQNPRYRAALDQSSDSHAFVRELQSAGYATDNQYASKIISILERPLIRDDQGEG